MIPLALLPPLPVAGPLAIAAMLLMFAHRWPRRVPDVIALLTALAAAVVCIAMARHGGAPLVYWFGGWAPRHGFPLGIGFVMDQPSAAFAAFIAILFAATLLFAWGYFDEVHAHFHVLMLLFMAGMIGFCLTHDLFNMFVWFEVMSVAGFALTGYQLRTPALEGALNFTIVNTIGSYLILSGVGLLYARIGALDFSALEQGVAQNPRDIVVLAAFTVLTAGFLIKAAQVPFQFWLADAHSVAPSPVSVIFSGAMVSIGIFGVARLYWAVFAPAPEIAALIRTLLLALGIASTLTGGLMAVAQRHVKRLLAFSTISHVGILLIGFSLLSRTGLSGMFIYLIGHGLVKASLFMVAGILLATKAGIDEIGLRGKGRDIWPVGLAMALAGLLLAGLPLGLMGQGMDFIEAAAKAAGKPWASAAIAVGAACTGAAVLRAAGRIFIGFGPVSNEEEQAPTDEEQEKADRPLWLMLLPTLILLGAALFGADAARHFIAAAVPAFMHPDVPALLGLAPFRPLPAPPLPAPPTAPEAWISVVLALLIAGFGLGRQALPGGLVAGVDALAKPLLDGLQKLHSGLIGDYVAWLTFGLALFAVTFALL